MTDIFEYDWLKLAKKQPMLYGWLLTDTPAAKKQQKTLEQVANEVVDQHLKQEVIEPQATIESEPTYETESEPEPEPEVKQQAIEPETEPETETKEPEDINEFVSNETIEPEPVNNVVSETINNNIESQPELETINPRQPPPPPPPITQPPTQPPTEDVTDETEQNIGPPSPPPETITEEQPVIEYESASETPEIEPTKAESPEIIVMSADENDEKADTISDTELDAQDTPGGDVLQEEQIDNPPEEQFPQILESELYEPIQQETNQIQKVYKLDQILENNEKYNHPINQGVLLNLIEQAVRNTNNLTNMKTPQEFDNLIAVVEKMPKMPDTESVIKTIKNYKKALPLFKTDEERMAQADQTLRSRIQKNMNTKSKFKIKNTRKSLIRPNDMDKINYKLNTLTSNKDRRALQRVLQGRIKTQQQYDKALSLLKDANISWASQETMLFEFEKQNAKLKRDLTDEANMLVSLQHTPNQVVSMLQGKGLSRPNAINLYKQVSGEDFVDIAKDFEITDERLEDIDIGFDPKYIPVDAGTLTQYPSVIFQQNNPTFMKLQNPGKTDLITDLNLMSYKNSHFSDGPGIYEFHSSQGPQKIYIDVKPPSTHHIMMSKLDNTLDNDVEPPTVSQQMGLTSI